VESGADTTAVSVMRSSGSSQQELPHGDPNVQVEIRFPQEIRLAQVSAAGWQSAARQSAAQQGVVAARAQASGSQVVECGNQEKRRARSRAWRIQVTERAAHRAVIEALRGRQPSTQSEPVSIRHVDVEFRDQPRRTRLEPGPARSTRARKSRVAESIRARNLGP
jgi:hypothetical protein